jgi:hypothetical protein
MMLIILQTQTTAQKYSQNHYIDVAFAYCSIFTIRSPGNMLFSLECHSACHFRILFLPVLYPVYCAACAQNGGKALFKTTSQYTVIHTYMYIMIFKAKHSMLPYWKQRHRALQDDREKFFRSEGISLGK